jgi:hypothetical protein
MHCSGLYHRIDFRGKVKPSRFVPGGVERHRVPGIGAVDRIAAGATA